MPSPGGVDPGRRGAVQKRKRCRRIDHEDLIEELLDGLRAENRGNSSRALYRRGSA